MQFYPILLFQVSNPSDCRLPLSGFAPIFEVFMGIGIAFYVLTRIDDFLHYILGVKRGVDQSIVATIDVNIELGKTLATEANEKKESDIVLDISEYENKLIDLKGEIERGKNRILYNSRFYFLTLGMHAFTMLVFCGMEEYCLLKASEFTPAFFSAILFTSIYFLVLYTYLTVFTFHDNHEEPLLPKIFLLVVLLAFFVLLGVYLELNILPCESLVGFGVFSQLAPFALLMYRHHRFQRFIRIGKFDQTVNEVNQKLLRIKIRLNR